MKESKQLTFEIRSTSSLIPYARNARTHSKEQVQQLAGSIKEFGFMNPVIISKDGGIIAGHGRVLAAQLLKLETVPCIVEDHLTEAQKRAYILADNKLSLNAGWDEDMLRVELEDLKSLDFNLDLTGFSEEDLSSLIKNLDITNISQNTQQEDIEQEVVEEPVSREGDLWILGEHKVICGDSTQPDVVHRLLLDEVPVLMVTDPPYGVNYDPRADKKGWIAYAARTGKKNRAGTKRQGVVLNDDNDDWRVAYTLFPGDVAYVWHAASHCRVVADGLEDCGFEIISSIVWNKSNFALSRGDYHWKHEHCWYAVKEGKKHHWQGARDQSTVWDIPVITNSKEGAWGHGTQKPIECMLRPILNNTASGELVYDPFLGSGTTVIAGERSGRKVRGCELCPKYVDTIIIRWQQETGNKAVREDGMFYDDLVSER